MYDSSCITCSAGSSASTGLDVHAPPRAKLSTGRYHGFPAAVAQRLEQQDLRRRAAGAAAQQASLDHARDVEDEEIASRNQADDVAKVPVLDATAGSLDNHEP